MFSHLHLFKCLVILVLVSAFNCSQEQDQQAEVSRWADDIGLDLNKLGKIITKENAIKEMYHYMNAQVEEKDPEKLLNDVVKDIERMMDRKMDAIRCISQTAERASYDFQFNATANYSYYSSKYSSVVGQKAVKLPESLEENKEMYLQIKLNNDTHFYNLAVDTNCSSVHVPTNIHDKHDEAAFAIQWSEALNDVFTRNYESDPALSWQYFGSTSGVMRHYPAKKWHESHAKDLFDCRIRTWYIEAATCTKDVVILVDNSGSMDGMGKHIGALTANSILDTFSNNDYINVLYYNVTTNYTIACFEDMLVQATEENIVLFKDAIRSLKPNGKTQLSQALAKAFDLLGKYRDIRGCNSTNSTCNQAIMVITDGITRNLSETVIKYNYLDNGRYIPVRLFTYLIGKEVTNVEEILWMACANRGYHTHVQSLEQVTASVLQYINVIARPLVLQTDDHPVSWTHAYIDDTYDDKNDDQINEPYRLLTSVAVPAFDKKANENNKTRVANLLGVAGTDVPIADIEKLTLPYKVGVNAYAFIVSNNGYVLMHRDLRPMYEGMILDNYNSIDLTEVEQFDNDAPPRDLDETLLELRKALVYGISGSKYNISIKYHYDDMRRVTRQKYNYYYAPLKSTPFSIAFAIPDGYGSYSLDVGDEISKNRHTETKLTDSFQGDNWKIHPQWVYCKYHYLEDHEYKTPELELLHFLDRMYNPNFTWEGQYRPAHNGTEEENLDKVECRLKTHNKDDYYCDRQLVQRLVFDAKLTHPVFEGSYKYNSNEEHIFQRYNVTLRFVATMSGLTRWEYLSKEVDNNTKKKFGKSNARAIDETWYRSAVVQHEIDADSFVYSVPFDSGDEEDLLITGSYAIFPTDAGKSAPGSVVGFQFAHKNFRKYVVELSSKVSTNCPDCGTCNTTLDCYIVDNNGYILLSGDNNDTGVFFGEIEGDVMDSMLAESIYDKVTVYDYQTKCNREDDEKESSGNGLLTPLDYFYYLINWCIFKLAWFALEVNVYNSLAPVFVTAQELSATLNFTNETFSISSEDDDDDDDDSEKEEYEENHYPCEKKRDLFILINYTRSTSKNDLSRPYFIKQIKYTNLIFVAINTTVPITNKITYSTRPQKIIYENDTVYPCQKLGLNNLPRRHLTGCFNYHPEEKQIKVCGTATFIKPLDGIALLCNLLVLCLNKSLY